MPARRARPPCPPLPTSRRSVYTPRQHHYPSRQRCGASQGAIMATERTLSIIKPDATRRNLTGKVNACLEAAGLRIVAQKRLQLTQAQAETFYAVHKERPFYRDLVTFMTSGPVVAQVLEGENAVVRNR